MLSIKRFEDAANARRKLKSTVAENTLSLYAVLFEGATGGGQCKLRRAGRDSGGVAGRNCMRLRPRATGCGEAASGRNQKKRKRQLGTRRGRGKKRMRELGGTRKQEKTEKQRGVDEKRRMVA